MPEEDMVSRKRKRSPLCNGAWDAPHSKILPFGTPPLSDRFVLDRKLGEGRFGLVRACTDSVTSAVLACKTILKAHLTTDERVEEVRREIAALQRVAGHEGVVELHSVHEDAEAVHLIMDMCEGGELYDAIAQRGSFPEGEAARLFHQLVSAVAHCHSKGVMHRDLKPENVLLCPRKPSTAPATPMSPATPLSSALMTPGTPGCTPSSSLSSSSCPSSSLTAKLADFGLALFLQPGQRVRGMGGSAFYMAPEVVSGDYDMAADVWSLGVVLYVLLSGTPPFWSEDESAVLHKIVHEEVSFPAPIWQSISSEAKSLVKCMLTKDPERRPSARRVLTNPWLLVHVHGGRIVRRKISQDSPLRRSPMVSPARVAARSAAFAAAMQSAAGAGAQEGTAAAGGVIGSSVATTPLAGASAAGTLLVGESAAPANAHATAPAGTPAVRTPSLVAMQCSPSTSLTPMSMCSTPLSTALVLPAAAVSHAANTTWQREATQQASTSHGLHGAISSMPFPSITSQVPQQPVRVPVFATPSRQRVAVQPMSNRRPPMLSLLSPVLPKLPQTHSNVPSQHQYQQQQHQHHHHLQHQQQHHCQQQQLQQQQQQGSGIRPPRPTNIRTKTLMASLAFSPHGVSGGGSLQPCMQNAFCPPKQALLLRMPSFIAPRSSSMVAHGANTATQESEENRFDGPSHDVWHVPHKSTVNQSMPLTMRLSNTLAPLHPDMRETLGSCVTKSIAPLPLPSSPVAMSDEPCLDESEATTPPTLRRRLFPQPDGFGELPA